MNKVWVTGVVGVLALFLLSGLLVKLIMLAAAAFAMYWCLRNHKEEWIKQVAESFKTIFAFIENIGTNASKKALKWLKKTTDNLKDSKKGSK